MTDDLVDKARRSVFEKIGRNVWNLQKVEGLMKVLVILYSGVCGTATEVKARMRKFGKVIEEKNHGTGCQGSISVRVWRAGKC